MAAAGVGGDGGAAGWLWRWRRRTRAAWNGLRFDLFLSPRLSRELSGSGHGGGGGGGVGDMSPRHQSKQLAGNDGHELQVGQDLLRHYHGYAANQQQLQQQFGRRGEAEDTTLGGPIHGRRSVDHDLTDGGGEAGGSAAPPHSLVIFGLPIGHWSGVAQYSLLAAGVFFFLILYGYLQELVVMYRFKRSLGLFITFLQFTGYVAFSLLLSGAVKLMEMRREQETKDAAKATDDVDQLLLRGKGGANGAVRPRGDSVSHATAAAAMASNANADMLGTTPLLATRHHPLQQASLSLATPQQPQQQQHQQESLIAPNAPGASATASPRKSVSVALARSSSGSSQERKVPLYVYAGLAAMQAIMQGFTNVSMLYLNYPAKVLFKSSRLVMTMLFGALVMRKRYSAYDYVVVLCMVSGLITFLQADMSTSPDFSAKGVTLIVLAIGTDAAILNIQEACLKRYNASQDELVLYSYSGAALIMLVMCIITGELSRGFVYIEAAGHLSTFGLFFAFCAAGFLGVTCVAALTKRFGALVSAITTTTRKALTLVLSFIMFPKPVTGLHILGGILFCLGLILKGTKAQLASARDAVSPRLQAQARRHHQHRQHARELHQHSIHRHQLHHPHVHLATAAPPAPGLGGAEGGGDAVRVAATTSVPGDLPRPIEGRSRVTAAGAAVGAMGAAARDATRERTAANTEVAAEAAAAAERRGEQESTGLSLSPPVSASSSLAGPHPRPHAHAHAHAHLGPPPEAEARNVVSEASAVSTTGSWLWSWVQRTQRQAVGAVMSPTALHHGHSSGADIRAMEPSVVRAASEERERRRSINGKPRGGADAAAGLALSPPMATRADPSAADMVVSAQLSAPALSPTGSVGYSSDIDDDLESSMPGGAAGGAAAVTALQAGVVGPTAPTILGLDPDLVTDGSAMILTNRSVSPSARQRHATADAADTTSPSLLPKAYSTNDMPTLEGSGSR